jgi:cytochrome c-type biogenesis protein CcmH/NrfG
MYILFYLYAENFNAKCSVQAKNKVALRSLAILLRQQEVSKAEQHSENITEALAKATESVEMDPSDGLSWLVLGNSYLVYFFSIVQSPQKMKQALAAYLQAVSLYLLLYLFIFFILTK